MMADMCHVVFSLRGASQETTPETNNPLYTILMITNGDWYMAWYLDIIYSINLNLNFI
jgi:hypothetical protein